MTSSRTVLRMFYPRKLWPLICIFLLFSLKASVVYPGKVRVATPLIWRKHYGSFPPCLVWDVLSPPSSPYPPILLLKNSFVCFMCMWESVCVYCTLQLLTEDDPLVRVIGSWELPDVGAGNWVQVLCKSSECSEPLSRLSGRTDSLFM